MLRKELLVLSLLFSVSVNLLDARYREYMDMVEGEEVSAEPVTASIVGLPAVDMLRFAVSHLNNEVLETVLRENPSIDQHIIDLHISRLKERLKHVRIALREELYTEFSKDQLIQKKEAMKAVLEKLKSYTPQVIDDSGWGQYYPVVQPALRPPLPEPTRKSGQLEPLEKPMAKAREYNPIIACYEALANSNEQAALQHLRDLKESIAQGLNLSINSTFGKGETLLHQAVIVGFLPVIEALLSFEDINVNALSSSGRTPLHYAAANMHTPQGNTVIMRLLERGANPLIFDGAKKKAIDYLGQTYAMRVRGTIQKQATLQAMDAQMNTKRESAERLLNRAARKFRN